MIAIVMAPGIHLPAAPRKKRVLAAGARARPGNLAASACCILRHFMVHSAASPGPLPPRSRPPAGTTGLPLSLRGVERRFGEVRALAGVDLEVPAGQFLAILGPSGCGKSTLLRLVAALDRPTAGTVAIAGTPVARGRRPAGAEIGFVFQEAHLLPWRTLVRNVELPLELAGVERRARRERALALIAQVGLADAARRYPAQLSGGMRMRASLARALVTNPTVLLLDEPFAALDELTRQRLDRLLHQLWRERRFTVLFVTHSIHEAVFLAERVVMCSARPARITADRQVALPLDRTAELRSTVEFARQAGELYQDLLFAEEMGGP